MRCVVELFDGFVELGQISDEGSSSGEGSYELIEGRGGVEVVVEAVGMEGLQMQGWRGWHCCEKDKMPPTLLDLPEEVLQVIHKESQKKGARICDLWFRISIYEHRVRGKVFFIGMNEKMARDYVKESTDYYGRGPYSSVTKLQQKHRREKAARAAARRSMLKSGKVKKDQDVDHKNGNAQDNRKSNLRATSVHYDRAKNKK